ncbi:hypothetical protein MPER_15113, partial [Moniliophthora perniciosa FA553]
HHVSQHYSKQVLCFIFKLQIALPLYLSLTCTIIGWLDTRKICCFASNNAFSCREVLYATSAIFDCIGCDQCFLHFNDATDPEPYSLSISWKAILREFKWK